VTGVFRSNAIMVMITAITPSLKASRRWVSIALPAFEAAPASVGCSLIGTVRPTCFAMSARSALRGVAPEHDRVLRSRPHTGVRSCSAAQGSTTSGLSLLHTVPFGGSMSVPKKSSVQVCTHVLLK
jgi:hypothetical protein